MGSIIYKPICLVLPDIITIVIFVIFSCVLYHSSYYAYEFVDTATITFNLTIMY